MKIVFGCVTTNLQNDSNLFDFLEVSSVMIMIISKVDIDELSRKLYVSMLLKFSDFHTVNSLCLYTHILDDES